MANVYCSLLPKESLVVHGSLFLDKICLNLMSNSSFYKMITDLLPNGCSETTVNIVKDYLIGIYTHMRGKNFCFKLFKKGAKL